MDGKRPKVEEEIFSRKGSRMFVHCSEEIGFFVVTTLKKERGEEIKSAQRTKGRTTKNNGVKPDQQEIDDRNEPYVRSQEKGRVGKRPTGVSEVQNLGRLSFTGRPEGRKDSGS